MEAPMTASTTPSHTTTILDQVVSIVQNRFYDPKFGGLDWQSVAQARAPEILGSDSPTAFAEQIENLLAALKAHPTLFYHQSASALPLQKAVGATVRAASNGLMLQDVLIDGPAAQAGLEFGDVIRSIDGVAVTSAPMLSSIASAHEMLVTNRAGSEVTVRVTGRKPMRTIDYSTPESGIGYIRISMFPGLVGIDFAHELDRALAAVGDCRALIVDLRGNPGGGSGNLRLMSYLTPERRPVGYSLTRPRAERGYRREDLAQFRRVPSAKASLIWLALRFKFVDKSIVVVTEGLPRQKFHGHIVMLVNEHTTSGAEIVAGFAKDHGLATLVGHTTAGKLLGWSTFRLEHEYRLVIPVSNYLTWEGKSFEGIGVVPDVEIDFSEVQAKQGIDVQLERALAVARSM
jgi:C-terminal processing protease CtpA/Prc